MEAHVVKRRLESEGIQAIDSVARRLTLTILG